MATPRRIPTAEPTRIGRRGTIVIPATLRKQFGMEEGAFVLAEAGAEGVLLRPVSIQPIEVYSPERKAEFLLSSTVDADDYARATRVVRRMGLDPSRIPHRKPPGRR